MSRLRTLIRAIVISIISIMTIVKDKLIFLSIPWHKASSYKSIIDSLIHENLCPATKRSVTYRHLHHSKSPVLKILKKNHLSSLNSCHRLHSWNKMFLISLILWIKFEKRFRKKVLSKKSLWMMITIKDLDPRHCLMTWSKKGPIPKIELKIFQCKINWF